MDLASLQIEIDSRKAQQAKKDLEGLATAAEKTEAATDSLSQATAEGENRYQAIARAALERQAALNAEIRSQMEVGTETRKVTAGMQAQAQEYTRIASAEHQARLANERQAAAMKAAAEAAEQNRASLHRLMTQIDPLQGKLDRLDDMERQLTQSFRQGVVDLDSYSTALAKLHGQRAQISSAQMDQVAAGAEQAASSMEALGINTATARYNMLMLGRAAATGDMRMASSSMIQLGTNTNLAGAAARAAIHPFTLLAAAALGAFVMYERGAQEARNFNLALIETGYAAGVTSSQLSGMARRIADETGSIGEASAALVELVRAGRIAGRDLEAVGGAMLTMSKATGRAVSDMVSEFASLSRDPVRGIEQLNDRYNYLTIATYEQIRALVDQGREQDAVSAAVRAHANMMDERAPQIAANIGTIERAWAAAKSAVSGYMDAAMNIGRQRSLEDIQTDIADYDARIAQLESAPDGRGLIGRLAGPSHDEQLQGLRARRAMYVQELEQTAREIREAEEQARYQEIQSAGIGGARLLAEAAMRGDKAAQKAAEIAQVQRAANQAIMAAAADVNLGEQERTELINRLQEQESVALADIEKRHADKTPKTRTRVDEGQRLIAQMNERLGLIDKETEYERMLFQIQSGRYEGLADWQKEAALDLAEQIDATTRQIETERILKDLREQQTITQAQFMRELESFGAGDSMRELNSELAKVEDRYRAIIEMRANSPLGLREDDLEAIRESMEIELEMVREHHLAKKEIEQDWRLGAIEGLHQYAEEAGNVYQQMSDTVAGAFSKLEDELVGFVTTGEMDLTKMLRSVGEEVVRMLVRAGLQMAANALLGQTSAAASAAMAAATGTAMATAYAPAAAMASLASFGGNSAPAMAGITSTVALTQGLALTGMAHDGIDSVPKTGTWLLEKGERVMTSDTSARLDAMLERIERRQINEPAPATRRTELVVNLIENPDRGGEVEARTDSDGNEELNIFVADIRGAGRRAQVLEATYGLQRVGR